MRKQHEFNDHTQMEIKDAKKNKSTKDKIYLTVGNEFAAFQAHLYKPIKTGTGQSD